MAPCSWNENVRSRRRRNGLRVPPMIRNSAESRNRKLDAAHRRDTIVLGGPGPGAGRRLNPGTDRYTKSTRRTRCAAAPGADSPGEAISETREAHGTGNKESRMRIRRRMAVGGVLLAFLLGAAGLCSRAQAQAAPAAGGSVLDQVPDN